jgi:hypothetical protein
MPEPPLTTLSRPAGLERGFGSREAGAMSGRPELVAPFCGKRSDPSALPESLRQEGRSPTSREAGDLMPGHEPKGGTGPSPGSPEARALGCICSPNRTATALASNRPGFGVLFVSLSLTYVRLRACPRQNRMRSMSVASECILFCKGAYYWAGPV